MTNKSLIHIRNTKTWTGDQLHLEYYLINDVLLGGSVECYGVEILAKQGGRVEYAGIPHITLKGTRILELIDLLAAGSVTPTGLSDVVQDWL